MVKQITFLFLLLVGIIMVLPAHAQSKRKKVKNIFGAGIILGINSSQIDGDNVSGFDKQGVYGGLRGIVRFSRRTQLNMELVYSQRGSKWGIGPNGFKTTTGGELKLDYIEVPVLFKLLKKDGLRGTYLEAGFSYSRKVRTSMTEDVPDAVSRAEFDRISDSLKSNDFSLIGGVGYRFENNLGFGIRYTASLTPFYKISDEELATYINPVDPEIIRRMRNYFLTFFASYDFK